MGTVDANNERTRRSLHPFGFAAGLYLALLALPLVFELLDLTGAAAQYVAVLGTLAAVTGVVWLAVARIDGAARRLGARRARWLPPVLPFGYVVAGYALLDSHNGAGLGYFIVGLSASLVGVALGMVALKRYFESVVAGAKIQIELEADWPAVTPRRVRVVQVCGALLAVVGIAAIFLSGLDWSDMSMIPLWFIWLAGGDSLSQKWTVSVSDVGLVRETSAAHVTGWNTFTHYTRTDDALVLHRLWRPDIRLALDDVAEPDAVEATIARHCPPA